MSNEFKVKNGLIVIGDLTTSGTITINGALAATQSWVTSQAYLTSSSLTSYATQSYVTSAIASLVDSAPGALDTLRELATALGNDASFSTTVTNSIAAKLPLAGGTLTGALTGTSATFSGNVTLGNNSDLVFQDLAGTFPTTGKGFDWTLNNDGARIYAMQPSSDSIDLIFQLRDNATVNDRFVFWVDDYQGAAFDKYPLIIKGGTEFDLKDSALYTNTVLRLSNSGVLQNVTGNISMFTNNAGYLTSYSETDTLQSVTNRGATTTNRVEFQYSVDRYSQAWKNTSTGAYWWVTTDSDKLGFHRNADGDKFYFSNTGDFYSTTNGWLSTALAAKQNASTAINTSNIASQSVSYATSAGSAGYVTNQSGQLASYDNRTISPSETNASYLQFGFTSWGNNNSDPYADYLHLRSYPDSSGGSDNLVMFLKSGIGMRIYQQTFGSASAYSSYADVWHSGNLTNLNQLTNGPGYITASALSPYLPLTGGTLTGGLSGTTATFNSTVQLAGNGIKVNWYNAGYENWYAGTRTSTTQWSIGSATQADILVLNNAGIATFSNNLITTNGIADPGYVRITNPGGGVSVGNSPVSAAIKIALPANGSFTNIMLSFTVHIFDYALGKTRTLKIAGYTYYNQDWYNMSVYQSGGELIGNINVRFGVEGGRNCVWIGETNTYWSYPNIFVTDVQCGHSQTANLTSGWTISLVTTLGTVQNTIVAYTNITTKDIGGTTNYVSKFTGATTLGNSLIFDNGTNVGIGTVSPGSKLHVISNENSDAAGAIRTTALNLSQYADYSFGGITSSYFYRIVSGTNQHISLMPGGTGNIGIGTTSPLRALHVVGGVGTAQIQSTGTSSHIYFGDTNSSVIDNQGMGSVGNNLWFSTGGFERMRITSGGSLLIGDTTQGYNPQTQGYLFGVKSNTTQTFISIAKSGQTLDSGGMIVGLDTTTGYVWMRESTDLTFGTNNTTRVTIAAGGNVGIGTSSPASLLHIYSTSVSPQGITIQGGDESFVKFLQGGGGVKNWGLITTNLAAGDFGIYQSTSVGGDPFSAGTAKLYFNNDGNVGIGTTSPVEQLTISGTGSRGIGVSTITSGDPYVRLYDNTSAKADIWWGRSGNYMGVNSIGAGSITAINPFGGNVGIGTAVPGYLLDVAGTSRSDMHIFRSNQSAPTADAFIFRPADNTIALGTANTERMRITSGGNVLIGTTTDAGVKLDVSNGSNNVYIRAITSGSANWATLLLQNGDGSWHVTNDDTGTFNIGTTNDPSTQQKVSITSGGNVGIGTTSPTEILHLSRIATDNYIKVEAGGQGANYSGLMLTEYGINWGWSLRHSAGTDALYISYQDNTPTFTDAVTFTRNGNVGIGTNSPSTKLDVNGVISATSGNSTQWNTAYGWGNHASAGYQAASTAITTSNIASQSVSYATSAGSAGSAGYVNNQSGQLASYDNRTISPSETNASYLQFGFTSWGNNNSDPYADYLHLRSYPDSSGGSDNLVMFLKSGIGMRIYQQTFGSASAYSSYADVWHSGNLTNLNQLTNGPGYITTYVETDTLASVTGRGATTTSPITINGGTSQPLSLTTANGSPWHLSLNRTDLGLTSRVFAHNSPYNGWYFEHNISIAGNTNWHSGNLTNLNQLTNGPGYITGYTETDTLQSVTSRGASTNTHLYINNNNPTLYLQDTDHRSAMIHVNSDYFYILNGAGTNSTGWVQPANSRYLFTGNLNNNDITFGGSGDFAGTVTASGGNSSNWNTAYSWGNHASASYATTSYVTTQINNLIAGAPGALDTLDELAAALGDDSNFATTVTNSIAAKLPLAGGNMTGAIIMSGTQQIKNAGYSGIEYYNAGAQWQAYIGTENNTGNLRYNSYSGSHTWYANSVQKMALDLSGNLTISGFLTESSSLKLKENVETSEGNLEKVVNLRPVTYNKIGSQTTELGLIAEEVATVYPEFVQYDESGEPVGVNYSRLTAALIGAVKELTQRIETLEKNG